MKLYDIIANLKFIGIKNYQELEVDALTCDSKEKTNNGLYFCIKGTKHDGHDYAMDAINNGATCLVVERFLSLPITQILVSNARKAMSYISSIFYETYKSKMKFIGITGTNGKTTTTFALRQILTKMGKKVGLIGTEGVYMGNLLLPATLTTPDPIVLHKLIADMERNGCEYCVMEVSAHAIALNKIDDIMYDCVALSNITKDHLDFFLNMDNYFLCKSSLFDYRHAKAGVINTDAKYARDIIKKSNLHNLTVGRDGELKLIDINNAITNTVFSLEYKGNTYHAKTNLIGEYNVYNLMLATGVLLKLGFDIKEILLAVKESEINVPGRFNVLNTNTDFSVVIDYAHTPDGIKNILSAIKNLPVGNIITVFGCGGNRDKTKRPEMGRLVSQLSDYVVVTSDNPRFENPEMIIDDILKGIDDNHVITIVERKSAIEYALGLAKKGDIVAILGKGAESYQEINGIKIHYSDYEVVDNYLNNIEQSEIHA